MVVALCLAAVRLKQMFTSKVTTRDNATVTPEKYVEHILYGAIAEQYGVALAFRVAVGVATMTSTSSSDADSDSGSDSDSSSELDGSLLDDSLVVLR